MGSPDEATAWCAAIRAALTLECGGEAIVYGPDSALASIPVVDRLRARGAHFFWVALMVGAVLYWELHVGIVVDPAAGTARSGLHRAMSSDVGARLFAALEAGRATRGLEIFHSEAAEELQFLYPARDLHETTAIATLCGEAHEVLTWATTGLEDFE